MRAMNRPTRKLQNLIAKSERKTSRSRRNGAKAKRWKKQIEQYRPLVEQPAEGSKPSQ